MVGRVVSRLTRRWLLCREQLFQLRFGWNNDPSEQVGDDAWAGSGGERQEDAEDAHERFIEIEIVSKAGADTGDLFVGAGACQSFRGAPRRGRNAHDFPAVGAEVDVLSDVFTASVAVHRPPFWIKIRGSSMRCSARLAFWAKSSFLHASGRHAEHVGPSGMAAHLPFET
jgi:hypothetical protein